MEKKCSDKNDSQIVSQKVFSLEKIPWVQKKKRKKKFHVFTDVSHKVSDFIPEVSG